MNDNLERLGIEDIARILTWSSWNGTWAKLMKRLEEECTDYPEKVEDFFKTEQDVTEKFALYSRMKEQGLDVTKIQEPEKPPDRHTKTLKPEQTFDTKSSEPGKEMKFFSCGAPEDVDENGRLIFP